MNFLFRFVKSIVFKSYRVCGFRKLESYDGRDGDTWRDKDTQITELGQCATAVAGYGRNGGINTDEYKYDGTMFTWSGSTCYNEKVSAPWNCTMEKEWGYAAYMVLNYNSRNWRGPKLGEVKKAESCSGRLTSGSWAVKVLEESCSNSKANYYELEIT